MTGNLARISGLSLLAALAAALSACLGAPTPSLGSESDAPPATSSPVPTQMEPSPPLPTLDAGVQPYLMNVEEILRHSAVVIKDRAVGIPDACPTLYITAFPYSEPDRRAGMTLAATALTRRNDGSVILGEHQYLWNLKGEGVDPERCKQVFIQDRSEPGLIRITFQVQDPDDRSWRIGVASGPCPGIELWLAGYFTLANPDDFQLWITRYSEGAPVDYWLRDGKELTRYQWEPWQETLLWTLEPVPGELSALEWNEAALDADGDGIPDLAITWEIKGSLETRYYSPVGEAFEEIETSRGGR